MCDAARVPGTLLQPDGASNSAADARRRSVAVFAAVAAGIVLAGRFPLAPSALFAVSLLLIAAALVVPKRLSWALLLAGLVCVSGGRASLGWSTLPSDSIAHALSAARASDVPMTVEGYALTDSKSRIPPTDPMARFGRPFQPGAWFVLRVDALAAPDGLVRASGSLRVSVDSLRDGEVRAGRRIRISGGGSALRAPSNPGQTDWSRASLDRGVVGSLYVPSPALIEPAVSEAPAFARIARLWPALRAHLARSAGRILDRTESDRATRPGRGLIGAIILGERAADFELIRGPFQNAGVAHLLAISGIHVALMVGATIVGVRATGDLGRLEPLLVLAALAVYLMALPARASVIRAGLMAIAFIASRALGRRWDAMSVLCLVGTGILLVHPGELLAPGFQLSFVLVAALILFAEQRETGLAQQLGLERSRLLRIRDGGTEYVRIAAMCWCVSLPIVMYWFGIISVAGILASVVTLPLITLALYAAVVSCVVGVVVPPLAPVAGGVLDVLGNASVGLVVWIDSIPYSSIRVPGVPALWCVGATVVAFGTARRGFWRDPTWSVGVACVLIWLVVWWTAPMRPDAVLRIDTLDVGNGTCHVIRAGDEAVLWDCGGQSSRAGRTIAGALRGLGITRIDRAVISHANTDHFIGLPALLESIPIRTVVLGESFLAATSARPHGPEAYVMRELDRRRVRVRTVGAGDSIGLGETQIEIHAPSPADEFDNENDRSLVGRIVVPTDAGPRSVLLTGDIGPDAIGRVSHLRADVMELPHHGSFNDAALEWVVRTAPGLVVQSTGRLRAGDPRWNPARERSAWRSTAEDGAIVTRIHLDGRLEAGPLR